MGRRRGKPWGGPWYGSDREVARFEGPARFRYPNLRRENRWDGRTYSFTMAVPFYEERFVKVTLQGNSGVAKVIVDGPPESPHRYPDGSLCMWHPNDPISRKWVREDGLMALLGLIQLHLFREAWWREYSEWPGPEAPHDSIGKEPEEG